LSKTIQSIMIAVDDKSLCSNSPLLFLSVQLVRASNL